MTEELADSGSSEVEAVVEDGIDMEAAMDSISEDLFGGKPVVKTEEGEEVQEGLAGKEPKEKPEGKAEEKEEKPEEPETTEAKRAVPKSWKKEMYGFWENLDPVVQDYVEQRELQMRDGLEKDRGDANLGRVMRDVMSPYSEMLKTQGIDESVMVRNLMNAHYRLSTADEAGKRDLINQIAQSYNVPLDGETQKVDPAIQALQNHIRGIEYKLNASHEQALQQAHDRVTSEVEAFASDPEHGFFDEVSDEIVPLINAGYSLEDAYEKAIWLNPVTRQKEIDRVAKEASDKALEQAKQEAETARKAKAANVRGRDTAKASTEPKGTIDDTLKETYRDIQSRSH